MTVTASISSGPARPGSVVQGNRIGTTLDGLLDLGNGDDGIQVQDATGAVIGGVGVGAGNLVSGNDDDGVVLILAGTSSNTVRGNLIGTDAGGLLSLANTSDGILIQGAVDNTIGGGIAMARNVVSGNGDDGIACTSGAMDNDIQGNYVGTDLNGTLPLQNGDDGIVLQGASANVVGGTLPGAANVISGNVSDGILVSSSASGTGSRATGSGPTSPEPRLWATRTTGSRSRTPPATPSGVPQPVPAISSRGTMTTA